MPRKTRLVIVVNDAAFFLSHRLPIALGAQAAGYDVLVATPRDDASPRIEAAGLTFRAIPLSRKGTSPAGELRTIAALTQLYHELAPDIVHHVTAKPILYGGIASRLARVPAAVHAVSGLGYTFISPRRRARVVRQGMRAAFAVATAHPNCAIIFQNQDDRATFGAAIRTSNVVMIRGSGVDRTRFAPTPLPTGTPRVVMVSRMLWDKGVAEFVEAARHLRSRSVDVSMVLVGGIDPGNPAAVPRQQLDVWVAEGIVEWWDHRHDTPQILAEATIACLPSYREGMPKSLLEAAVAGRPIVTTDVPGCRDVIHGGEHGVLVPARDGAALGRALEALLGDRPRLERMAVAAARAGEEFGVEDVVAKTLGVYASLGAQP